MHMRLGRWMQPGLHPEPDWADLVPDALATGQASGKPAIDHRDHINLIGALCAARSDVR